MKDWHLVERAFLDAALGHATWNTAMNVVTQVTGSAGALLFPVGGRLAVVPQSDSMAAPTEAYFRGGWHERDERWAGLSHLKSRGITTEFDYTSPEAMGKSGYYEDFLRPHRLRWFAAMAVRSGDEFWSLSLQRTIEQGPFQMGDLRVLRTLSKRLYSAADITRAVGSALIDGAAIAFQQSQTAAVFIGRFGNVIIANQPAQVLFRQGDVRIANGRLGLRTQSASFRLEEAMKNVLDGRDRVSSKAVLAPRPEGRGLVVRVIPFEERNDNPLSRCQAVVILHDLDRRRHQQKEDWPELFGLSAGECRLIEALLDGLSVEQAGERMGLSRETIRSRLKDIFGKTQVSRQGELVALFSRLLT